MNRTGHLAGHIVAFVVPLIATTVHAEMPKGEYLEGKDSKVGVILAHGEGLDPDSQVVGPLRRAINKDLGFHTLSLQMPVVPGKRGPESGSREHLVQLFTAGPNYTSSELFSEGVAMALEYWRTHPNPYEEALFHKAYGGGA